MFTYIAWEEKLLVETGNSTKISQYNLKITAKYAGEAYLVADDFNFIVDITSAQSQSDYSVSFGPYLESTLID